VKKNDGQSARKKEKIDSEYCFSAEEKMNVRKYTLKVLESSLFKFQSYIRKKLT